MHRRPSDPRLHPACSLLMAVTASCQDAVILISNEGQIAAWSRGAERMYGYSEEEAIGADAAMTAPAGRGYKLWPLLQQAAVGDAVIDWVEAERSRKSGEVFRAAVQAFPMYDEATALIGCAVIEHEISPAESAADAMEESPPLKWLRAGFLASANRDVRISLNAIVGMTALALEAELPPALRESLQAIRKSAESLLGEVRQELQVATIETRGGGDWGGGPPTATPGPGKADGAARQASPRRQHLFDSAAERRLRVLLVEDTPANQKLAKCVLAKRGHEVFVAANGQEALEMHDACGYDVILMDVLMPLMDGIQATRAIRASESRSGREPTPIIAMTACSMKGDRERCLEAGMDFYLSKPLSLPEMVETVECASRLARQGALGNGDWPPQDTLRGHEVGAGNFDESNGATGELANLKEALRRLSGDEQLLLDMIGFCEQDAPALLVNARQCYQAKDWSGLKRAAHTLKGLVSTFDADVAAAAALAVEEAAQTDHEALPLLIDKLNNETRRLIRYLARRREERS